MTLLPEPDPRPLADRLRPKDFSEFVGQSHLFTENSPLRTSIEQNNAHSMILWGPPGSGKTTFASLFSKKNNYNFTKISAIYSGVKEIRQEIEKAKHCYLTKNLQTILFVDEVHRFNKSQQDAFLPYIEDGTIIFIGATTENPSFSLNNALLSRTQVYTFYALTKNDLSQLCKKVANTININIDQKSIDRLIFLADGDARRMINLIENAVSIQKRSQQSFAKAFENSFEHQPKLFDNHGDMFYDLISALHKSIRGSNPHAAMYWFCRMVDSGADVGYIARRLTVIASEDIGNADPRALELAINGWQAFERIGAPEGYLNIAQVITYLASAPKSNASYLAFKKAMHDVKNNPSFSVPNHLVNAPTNLMKKLGKGKNYRYAHDEENAYAAGEAYFPDDMGERIYYNPNPRGLEIKIKEKLDKLSQLDKLAKRKNKPM